MRTVFEKSTPGHGASYLPKTDVPTYELSQSLRRDALPSLPELAEIDVSRHYTELAQEAFGVNSGFYPLGSCTMKYNPAINEELAALPGFTELHPLQPAATVQGCLRLLADAEKRFCEVAGMDAMTFQPAAGAHGEYTGLLLIKAYHQARGDSLRTKIIVPDSAHGTNPASAAMAGFDVVNINSDDHGCVDLDALRAACGPDTAGLMLTNPNTVGLFDPNIGEICAIVHEAGGLAYYDGANLNAIMGKARPGDMGFDVVHLNLHKSFSTPHGGGGPGSGPVGCKALLTPFLPGLRAETTADGCDWTQSASSIGDMKTFYGNFLVVVRAYAYLTMLGREGVPDVAENAVLNANYLRSLLKPHAKMAYDRTCMHEFVLELDELKKETGVSALDVAKTLIDLGLHPPTMYFPLIVHEALMVEPTETESKATLDQAAEAFIRAFELAKNDPATLHASPLGQSVGRPDEVAAARNPRLRYTTEG